MNNEIEKTRLPASGENSTGWPWDGSSRQLPETMPDGAPWPKISIITPSYNQGRFIEKTIRSVLLQGYPNLEYIVIDGGSTDNSISIIKKYDQWISFWVSEQDSGQSHAINKGFARATGEILAWLNSDDIYLPHTLFYIAEQFKKQSETVGAIVGKGHKIDEKGRIVYTPQIPEPSRETFLNWMGYGNFMQPSCFFRNTAWQKHGPLWEDLHYAIDLDLWLKMIKDFQFKKLDRDLSHALIHDKAKTTSETELMRAETIIVTMQHGGYDSAKKQIIKMADELARANSELDKIRSMPFYLFFRTIYRWITKLIG